jgi:hypothetical protein
MKENRERSIGNFHFGLQAGRFLAGQIPLKG